MIRVPKVRTGQPFLRRVMLKMAPLVMGVEPPDLLRILFYRAEFFGKPNGKWHQVLLRGPSEWTIGEREVFAAWVSTKNACRFCASAHTAIASRALGLDIKVILDNPRHSSLSEKAQAMLPFLEKLTVSPESVTAADIAPLRAVGISKDAISDGIEVVAMFSMMNRVVDAFGCEQLDAKQLDVMSKMLLSKGYEM